MKIGAISLGCDKNRVDTENLLGFAVQAGHEIVNDINEAEIVIVNSCAFLQSAVQESIDAVLEARSYENVKYVILAGCLPMRYINELQGENGLIEADAMIFNTTYERIGEVIERLQKGEKVILHGDESMTKTSERRLLTTSFHYAYLKIAEGCNNHCTFCAIPAIRGKYRSESIANLVHEASKLVTNGAKELILVAQDVTRYGIDLSSDGKPMLMQLLHELCKLDVQTIRLLYCYPDMVTKELIDFIDSEDKMAKYIDMPLQHASNSVLKRMNRRDTKESIKEKITYIRSKKSNIAIRSTFMVGFPGESEDDFNELCAFVQNEKLDYVGFFAYSKEDGTPAAKLKDQILQSEKKRRLSIVTALQSDIALQKAKAKIGETISIIYDGIDYDKQLFYGHAERTTPDVDPKVYFVSKVPIEIGETYKVKIKKVKKLDLYGENICI